MGGKRKEPEEVVKTLTINIKQKVITEMEKEGNPKRIVEKLVNDRYLKE